MRFTLVFIFNIIMTFSGIGQGLFEKYPEVQKEQFLIDQNDSLLTVSIVNEEFMENWTDGGGQLNGYYTKKGSIRKIEVIIFLSYGIQEYDFYLKNESPILIEDRFKQFSWDEEKSSFDHNHFDGGFHGTYIFKNRILVDHTSLGHNRFEDDQIDIEETFIAEFDNYFNKITKQLTNKG